MTDPRLLAAELEPAVAALADERTTDWWTARKRAAQRTTPSLTGPQAGAWRRTWALGERASVARRKQRRATNGWPPPVSRFAASEVGGPLGGCWTPHVSAGR